MGSSSTSTSSSTTPGHPIQAPRRRRNSGSRAVTSPPGLRFQLVLPSGNRSMSIGSRLATTTKSDTPETGSFGPLASRAGHLHLDFRGPDTEHRQEDAAFIRVGCVGRYYAPGLAGGVVSQWGHVIDFMGVRFSGHDVTVCEVRNQPQSALSPADQSVTGWP